MSKRIPNLSARKVISAFKQAGFEVEQGSKHTLLHKKDHPHVLAVPRHTGDLGRGLVRALIDASGLTKDAFLDLL